MEQSQHRQVTILPLFLPYPSGQPFSHRGHEQGQGVEGKGLQ